MSSLNTFNQELLLNEDNLHIALMKGDAGDFGKFTKSTDRNNAGNRITHPTIDILESSTGNTLMCQGSIRVTVDYSSEDYTSEQMDEVIAEVNDTMVEVVSHNASITHNVESKTRSVLYQDIANTVVGDWKQPGAQWALKADNIRVDTIEDNSKFICVTYLNNSFKNWNWAQTSVAPNESLSVSKKNVTYVMFTGPLAKDGLELAPYQVYKMKSSNLSLENKSDSNVLVFKWDK
jgi:hypothetical protein